MLISGLSMFMDGMPIVGVVALDHIIEVDASLKLIGIYL